MPRSRGRRTGEAPGRAVVASAPTRVDLAGGTLDIWPLSVLVPDAVTVNLAIELRARVEVRPRRDGAVAIVSLDRGYRLKRRAPLDSRRVAGPLSLLLRLVAAFGAGRPLTLTTRCEAPAGAGLGGSSALAVAAAGALVRWTGEKLLRSVLLRWVMNLETAVLRVPTGNQDYLAAIHGGLAAYRHLPSGTVREPIPLPAGLEERLVLAYTGEPRKSGYSNWEMFRRFVDGEVATVERLEEIGRIARKLAAALWAASLDEVGRLLNEEGRLRFGLAPAVSTPALARAAEAARRAGALGVKVCGAGGGGCLLAFAREGRRDLVARAMEEAGAALLPLRVARSGLRITSP